MRTTAMAARAMVLVCMVAALGCVATVVSPRAERPPVAAATWSPEDEPFYYDLAPYGEWVHVSGPGWVWSPHARPAGWQPYRTGHWVLTDYGWTWASDEQFGWVVYHYGRWHVEARYGWVWVPGTEWGPAWVAWHEGDGWVGWAPLPWQVRWQAGGGLDWGGLDISVALGPTSWCFVPARYVIDPGLATHIAPAHRNVTLIRNTVHVTNYTVIDNRVVNQSLKAEKIGRAVGHTVQRYRLESADAPDAPRGGQVRNGKFVVYRPHAERSADVPRPEATTEPEPPAREPRPRPQRIEKRARPDAPGPRPPARREAARDPAPAAPSTPAPAPPAAPAPSTSSPDAAPPSTPPAEPARAERPAETKQAPPGRAKGRGASADGSKPAHPKGKKSHPGEADCDQSKPEGCPGAEKH